MAGGPINLVTRTASRAAPAPGEGPLARWLLTGVALAFLSLFIVLPVANVFAQAMSKGWDAYKAVFVAPPAPADLKSLPRAEQRRVLRQETQAEKTRAAIRMTLSTAAVVVPLNTLFGLAAAWAIGKFRFRGRSLLVSVIDLPFSVSPVIAGLIFVLLFGRLGFLGGWAGQLRWPDLFSAQWLGFDGRWWPIGFAKWHAGIIFTPLATTLASAFVTFPFVARTLIPLMESQGTDEEEAALLLGASGWRTFWKVTLPNIKWALLYGVILCTARAMGEFGAVSVVSGSTDANDTMPLRVEKLWQEYNTQAAFAVASLLACLALLTLIAKALMEWKTARAMREEA